ncbi:MAG: DUF4397 domain-containing protein [Gemmatimonadaceae bacterium]|nr:DUF4397 domain-containing protein [Gemmatimonadaceae bacterium]
MLLLAACDGGGATTPGSAQSLVRVAHFVPDLPDTVPGLDLRVNVAMPAGYARASFGTVTPFVEAPVATTQVSAQFAPSTSADAPLPFALSGRLNLAARTRHTFLLVGLWRGGQADFPGFTVLVSDTAAVATTSTRLTAVHASPGVDGGIDVYLLPPGTMAVPALATPAVGSVGFRTGRSALVSSGSYAVVATRVGDRSVVLARQDPVTFAGGGAATVFLYGLPPGPGVQAARTIALRVTDDR